ncbi:transcription factor IIA, alpha/beta subunit [Fomitiporia mediterranea MF3/22]|uniref:transcription factor IIA, alpha/beta subunit n=1 Tax=Fomitiporia mediterranea (strain MF3/22) TaxID=694068 RepID=UPI0004408FDA|nr:transcription factor IIA, alpha/beta subunit [Fomitiporia mediterranea MF3/22]EJD02638.1 transcription factor IIA, alpha/beta subunit [Fomitiporia mediterranea MF3/22]
MSNKIVPAIYRAIIDDVITNIKSDFDDFGVGEDVLSDLQSRWENKVIASHVAEFEPQPQVPQNAPQHTYPPHVPHPALQPQIHAAYPQYAPPPPPPQSHVKAEPVENRFPLPSNLPTYIPQLPGPTLPGPPRPPSIPAGVQHHYGTTPQSIPPRPAYTQPSASAPGNTTQASSQTRIPQVDGPSSSASDSSSPPQSQTYAPPPRSLHPSLPQPSQGQIGVADSEEINSDLDDSDSDSNEEEQEGALGETDIVFCTYDKVARVKNKWKCVLKDGMIHVNGKDYLFGRCTCEFEW